MYIVLTWSMYILWKVSSNLNNWHIHHLTHTHIHVYVCMCVCVYIIYIWQGDLSSTFSVNFSFTIVLSTTVTMFYIRSSDRTAQSLYPFTNLLLFPTPPSSRQLLSFSLFWKKKIVLTPFIVVHIYFLHRHYALFVWNISLSIMPSKSIPVVTSGRISFFPMGK